MAARHRQSDALQPSSPAGRPRLQKQDSPNLQPDWPHSPGAGPGGGLGFLQLPRLPFPPCRPSACWQAWMVTQKHQIEFTAQPTPRAAGRLTLTGPVQPLCRTMGQPVPSPGGTQRHATRTSAHHSPRGREHRSPAMGSSCSFGAQQGACTHVLFRTPAYSGLDLRPSGNLCR